MKQASTSLIVAMAVTVSSSALADIIPPPSDAGDAAAAASDSGLPTTTRVDSGTEPVADEKAGGCSFGAAPMERASLGVLMAGAVTLLRRRRREP